MAKLVFCRGRKKRSKYLAEMSILILTAKMLESSHCRIKQMKYRQAHILSRCINPIHRVHAPRSGHLPEDKC